MKKAIILISLMFATATVFATIQTSIEQDKPWYVYMVGSSMNSQDNIHSITTEYQEPELQYVYTDDIKSSSQTSVSWINGLGGGGSSSSSGVEDESGVDNGVIDCNATNTSSSDNLITLDGSGNGTDVSSGDSAFSYYVNVSEYVGNEHCDVTDGYPPPQNWDWYEDDYDVGEVVDEHQETETYQRNAQATWHVQTGGKAIPGRQSLWQFSGSAQEILDKRVGPPYYGYGAPLYEVNPEIPYTQIAIGALGNLGADGNLWIALPDGIEKNITPSIAGNDFYTFGVSGTKYVPTLTASTNGTSVNLTTNTPEFCVGQQVSFAVQWSQVTWNLSQPPYVDSVQNWTLPDKYVNKAIEYSYTCTSYSQDDSLLSNNSTSCWFINGQGGNVSVGMNLHFANGQYVGLAAKGNITVYRPTFSDFHNDGNGFTWQFPNLVGQMSWDVTLNSKYNGLFGVTQLINSGNGNSVYYTGGDDLLDGNTEIYGTPEANGPSTYVPNSPAQDYILFGDSPSSTAAPCVYMQANFKDYLRFQPVGNNSIYVTIATNGWYMNGDACQFGSIQPNDLPPASKSVNDDTFPTWVGVRSGGGN